MIESILKEKSVWESLAELSLPIVLYGMGNGADMVLDEMENLGIKCSGVFASDDFVRGQNFRGFTVKKLSDFEAEYNNFIVAVSFATCIDSVIENIVEISKKHRLFVPCVPVYGKEIINRDFLVENAQEIEQAYGLFCDAESRMIFEKCVRFMFTGELEILLETISSKDDVFNDFFRLSDNEKYLDLGAYKGDTVEEFLHYSYGKYSSITAVEPDSRSFRKLTENCGELNNFTAVNACVSDYDGEAFFSDAGGRQSTLAKNGKPVKSVTVDTLAPDDGFTYIKADVEGAEEAMLKGASVTLSSSKPKLNIAVYHRSTDFFRIPLLIHRANPEYSFYLRRHKYIPCWDLNLYCL